MHNIRLLVILSALPEIAAALSLFLLGLSVVRGVHTSGYRGLANIERICGLLKALFPIAIAAAALIGLFGPLLVILQSAREAAFLHILGVTKKRARCILILEQAAGAPASERIRKV